MDWEVMCVSNVNVSSQAIKESANICSKAIDQLRITHEKLLNKYQEAGESWSDSKYHQLGDIVDECESSINKALRELEGCLKPLDNLSKAVQEYNEMNIAGSFIPESSGFFLNAGSRTPVNNGSWSGERGNSIWIPSDEAVLKDIQYYSEGLGRKVDGIEYQNGYADFSTVAVYTTTLAELLYNRTDNSQFVDCTLDLRAIMETYARQEPPNPVYIQWFDDEGKKAVATGQANIPGYTWHHDIYNGRIQLVPTSVHRACPHEGGRSIWGGGSRNR